MHSLPESTHQWLSTLTIVRPPITPSLVKTDASLRSYHRIQDAGHNTFILCKLEAHENFDRVLAIQKVYEASGVAVPKAHHWHSPHILFEDVGCTHLKTFLAKDSLSTNLQKQIIEQALAIQRIDVSKIPDCQTFANVSKRKEFMDFSSFAHDYPWKNLAAQAITHLLTPVLALPPTTIHKDFHWENLMIQNNQIRVLDYSDSLQGPPSYDLASLIADRGFYQRFPQESASLITHFCQQAATPIHPEHLWGTIALRLFKIIGNFDRLSRDIHPRYRLYQQEAIQTLKTIPWKTYLPKPWHPGVLCQLGEALSRL